MIIFWMNPICSRVIVEFVSSLFCFDLFELAEEAIGSVFNIA